MKNTDAFGGYHPITVMIYFSQVILYSMLFLHPVCLVVSFLSAAIYSTMLKGKKAFFSSLKFSLPVFLFTALLNPLFSHQGSTVIAHFPNGSPLTFESIFYGLIAGIMLVTVITWFACFNEIMTSDKFIYLFGKIIPSLSLILSMTLRFVPRFNTQLKAVINAQRCIGRDISSGKISIRIKNAIQVLSIMVTWSLENAIETADSMKARGYGLKGRTSFSIYRFDKRNALALIFLLACGAYIIVGAAQGALKFDCYPSIQTEWTPYTFSIFAVYAALCLTPIFINIREDIKWKMQNSKIA